MKIKYLMKCRVKGLDVIRAKDPSNVMSIMWNDDLMTDVSTFYTTTFKIEKVVVVPVQIKN